VKITVSGFVGYKTRLVVGSAIVKSIKGVEADGAVKLPTGTHRNQKSTRKTNAILPRIHTSPLK
jgi:hypothetical protein